MNIDQTKKDADKKELSPLTEGEAISSPAVEETTKPSFLQRVFFVALGFSILFLLSLWQNYPYQIAENGLSLAKEGKCINALPLLGISAHTLPKNSQILEAKAYCERQMGQFAEALSTLAQLQKIPTSEIQSLGEQCILLDQIGKTNDALSKCNAALAKNPRHFDAIWEKAAILSRQNKDLEALSLLQTVLGDITKANIKTYDPKQIGPTLALKGQILNKLGKVSQAIKTLDLALTLLPDNPDILGQKALSLQLANKPREAVTYYNKAIEKSKKVNPILLANLATVFETLGEDQEALSLYEQLLTKDPTNLTYLKRKASVLIKEKHFADAQEILDIVYEKQPDYLVAQDILLCLQQQEKFSEMVEHIQMFLTKTTNIQEKKELKFLLLSSQELVKKKQK